MLIFLNKRFKGFYGLYQADFFPDRQYLQEYILPVQVNSGF